MNEEGFQLFLKKASSFFISFLLLCGVFRGETEVKSRLPVGELCFSGVDVSDGYAVRVSLGAGLLRFNRVSFHYETTAAVRAVFCCRQGLKTAQEELLLSAKETKASMLLDGWRRRGTAWRLLSVRFSPVVEGERCVLSVSDFTCDIQSVPKGDVLYIENDRFKAGVSMEWGGGLCYFEDKNNNAYGNLLNCHDTGRLVQQSFYGPTEIEGYENGFYENTLWPYNPVQGGDVYGNVSKLMSVEASDDRISVVCRPLDWAQDGKPTQTYYTSVYTLKEDGLQVKNTAVDFLGVSWNERSQELPAFYTISALGTFWFYDGDKPWTGAPLRSEKNLEFWGGRPAFGLPAGSDETWCAWADASEYGVGLYTPVARSLLAGRFLYDGSSSPDANPTNYVAPLGNFALRFDEPFTYSYYLTAGTVADIRETFARLRP